jgi:hypothetical protein
VDWRLPNVRMVNRSEVRPSVTECRAAPDRTHFVAWPAMTVSTAVVASTGYTEGLATTGSSATPAASSAADLAVIASPFGGPVRAGCVLTVEVAGISSRS